MTYSLIKNNDNQLICPFCKSICRCDDIQDWWSCKNCNVNFNSKTYMIQFESNIFNKFNQNYTIHILLNKNISCIYTYHPREGYNLITMFNKILNITPVNLHEKLKTYLLLL